MAPVVLSVWINPQSQSLNKGQIRGIDPNVKKSFKSLNLFCLTLYTTNPTERSTAAIEPSTNESGLEWSIESHRALAEQWPSKSVECSSSAWLVLG